MPDMRIDRALSLKLVKPLHQWTGAAGRPKIPILMYHGIRAENATNGHPYFETCTAPRVFAAQMRFLRNRGYRAVDLNEAASLLAAKQDVSKTVVITFDDGFVDFYSSAFPVLLECGFTATIFVVPGFLNSESTAPRDNTYLSWNEVREAHEYGMHIGSHTMHHVYLPELPWNQIRNELVESRDAIEDALQSKVSSFAYPYAFPEHDREYSQRIRECLTETGYSHAVTTILGSARQESDLLLLPRIPVNTHDDLELFEAKLTGAYDWMHVAQYARKMLSHSIHTRQEPVATAATL